MLIIKIIYLTNFFLYYLKYISNVIWKYLFGKVADNLERSTENEDECYFS
jgi:hypothetical protein